MASADSETHARNFIRHHPDIAPELALRIFTSRLIGADPNLVLHGGGNTPVKLKDKNILGLAKHVAAEYDRHPDLEAIVIGNHGIFTFGEDAAAS